MASSVARMPADDWRDTGRLAAGVFGSHHPFARNLRKVLVRPEKRQGSPSPSPSLSPSTETVTRSRQSQILDRWAARQAKEMVTTIERQANEAEISALSVTSQPVSARAATFIRDTSPAPSDSSSTASSPGPGVDLPPNVRASSLIQMWREIEAEAGVPPPTPRAAGGGRGGGSDESETFGDWESDATTTESERGRVENIVRMLSAANTAASSSGSEEIEMMCRENLGLDHRERAASPRGNCVRVRGRREFEGLMARLEQERRRELDELMERRAVSRFPHRRRLQSFLRFLPVRRELAAQCQPRPMPRTSKLDQMQKESINMPLRQIFNHKDQYDGSGQQASAGLSRFHAQSPDRSYTCAADQLNGQTSNHGSEHRSNAVLDVESSRNSLVQHCDNSNDFDQFLQQRFDKRGRDDGNRDIAARNLSSISNHSFLTRQLSNCGNQYDAIENPATKKPISLQVQLLDNPQGPGYICTVNQVFEQCNYTGHRDGNGKAARKSSSNLHVQYADNSQNSGCNWIAADNSQNSGYNRIADQIAYDNSKHPDVPFHKDAEGTPPEVNSPHSRREELQEGAQSTCKSWDERNLWVSNLDLLRPLDTSTSQSMESDAIMEEIETSAEQDARHSDSTCISETANSWEEWGVSQHRMSPYFLENFSDNTEIRELLERRRVTTALASDFPEKMNRLITSFLQRQGRNHVDGDEYDEQFFSAQNHEFHNADHGAVASASSLIPLPYQTMYQANSWHDTREGLSQHLQEVDPVQDLQSDIADIHHEIYELRKLVESCMDWQRNLHQSIKQEVFSAVRQSVSMRDNSNWTPTRKGICCTCCEMPVDSLLYRCGHMCTCFKCANDLQWSSGRCPICQAPIVDVVRAYTNS